MQNGRQEGRGGGKEGEARRLGRLEAGETVRQGRLEAGETGKHGPRERREKGQAGKDGRQRGCEDWKAGGCSRGRKKSERAERKRRLKGIEYAKWQGWREGE